MTNGIIRGPLINIHCPHCHATSVPAETYDLHETSGLIHKCTTFVQCSVCRKKSTSKVSAQQIVDYSADDLVPLLTPHVSIFSHLPAIISLLFCWMPLGLIAGIVGIVIYRRTRGWPLVVSWIGAILSVLLNCLQLAAKMRV